MLIEGIEKIAVDRRDGEDSCLSRGWSRCLLIEEIEKIAVDRGDGADAC